MEEFANGTRCEILRTRSLLRVCTIPSMSLEKVHGYTYIHINNMSCVEVVIVPAGRCIHTYLTLSLLSLSL